MNSLRAAAVALLELPLDALAGVQDALAPSGPQAAHILELWHLMLGICGVVYIAVLVALGIALWRAPRASAQTPPDTEPLHTAEAHLRRWVGGAIALSVILLFVLLIASVRTDRALASLPTADAVEIQLTAHQWWWEATYDASDPGKRFTTANELHIPVGQPVRVALKSQDVIHSFWVPNLHGKKDLIPGHTITTAFRADAPGIYRGQCAEFCGYQHAKMALLVVAGSPQQYADWVARQRQPANAPRSALQQRGQQVFLRGTCPMCHAVLGTDANGESAPDLTHLASRRTLAAATLPNRPEHLAAWIIDPQAIKPGVNMPQNPLPPEALQALLAYLESLT
ncbi:MAG TPA: cytochrome c oxidase subunit II [Burkholderiales bacterium]|nr:cytochrome c oxidase subunit II [Burkholderiales bacterium]